MLGRGTRLCPDLFWPGQDKASFCVFDYFQNLEYFSQDIPATEGALGASLGKRLFDARLELIVELDRCAEQPRDRRPPEQAASHGDPVNESEVRRAVAELLQREVAAMKVDNFIVRPHRRLVEMYADLGAWTALTTDAIAELSQEVAGLPTGLAPESEEARFFDLIVLKLQLAILRSEPTFGLQARLREIAGLLAEKDAIPSVREQMALIQDVLTDEWWQDVTVPMLESMRRRLRGLVHLIDKRRRRPVYTDFEDSIGQETHFTLSGSAVGIDQTRFIAKARAFLQKHLDHLAVAKLRLNRPLTSSDLSELERLLGESGVGEPEDIRRAAEDAQGLGLFVRSLVGMDRVAAKQALASFTEGKTLTANQLEFVNLIVEHLTEHGVVEAERLYESPFTDLAPHGPDDLLASSELDELMRVLNAVRAAAIAA